MNRTLILFIFTFLGACNNRMPENESYHNATNEPIKPSTVLIADLTLQNTVAITVQDNQRQTLALGSGVIVDDGKVITNVHVIAGAHYCSVQRINNNTKYQVDGYFILDNLNDIAILSVPEIQANCKISINPELPKVGVKIYAAGNPYGLSGTFSEGIVSALRKFGKNQMIQISAPISPGSSGGAIVNEFGELVGIAVGGIENGQNLNFAIPAKYIDSLLAIKPSDIISFDIPLIYSTENKEIKKASDLVKIKNIVWLYDCGYDNYAGIVPIPPDNPIIEFSILNNTSELIESITLAIIIYDKGGSPVDYQTIITDDRIGTIMPGLAKKYFNMECDIIKYERYRENCTIQVSKKKGYKAEFRVLDYKIANR